MTTYNMLKDYKGEILQNEYLDVVFKTVTPINKIFLYLSIIFFFVLYVINRYTYSSNQETHITSYRK